MNHSLLKKVITDQHKVIRESRICRRPYTFEKNGNYVLTGIRRAGKSMLLYGLVQDLIAEGISWDQIIYINFEDERLSEFSLGDFNDIVAVQSEMSDQRGYYFLMKSRTFRVGRNLPGEWLTVKNVSILPEVMQKCSAERLRQR